MFRFRKIYGDLVTADGTVCIVYLAWVHALGIRSGFGGVEVYSPDGRREVLRAQAPAPQPLPAGGDHPVELRLDLPDGRFTLRSEPQHPPWRPTGPSPTPRLEWSVCVPRGVVTASWNGAGRPELYGSGYIDCVELTRPTRWAGVRALEWGRVHLPDATVVFTGVQLPSREWWRQAAHWSVADRSGPRVLHDFQLSHHQEEVRCTFPVASGAPLQGVVLRPGRVLHQGDAVDRARSPARLERLGLRAITGPSSETRWFSSAYALGGTSSPAGFALHEVVRFGR